MRKKGFLGLLVALALVLTPILGFAQEAEEFGPVFTEMREIVQREGVPEEGGIGSYRKDRETGIVYSIGKAEKGFSIMAKEVESQAITIVGYYPDTPTKYLSGVIMGPYILVRDEITKEDAEAQAKELLKGYKAGTICSVRSWQGLPDPVLDLSTEI